MELTPGIASKQRLRLKPYRISARKVLTALEQSVWDSENLELFEVTED